MWCDKYDMMGHLKYFPNYFRIQYKQRRVLMIYVILDHMLKAKCKHYVHGTFD